MKFWPNLTGLNFINHVLAYVRASNGEKWVGMRVLLIEDDSATAQFIERMLKSESFNVYTTNLGDCARCASPKSRRRS